MYGGCLEGDQVSGTIFGPKKILIPNLFKLRLGASITPKVCLLVYQKKNLRGFVDNTNKTKSKVFSLKRLHKFCIKKILGPKKNFVSEKNLVPKNFGLKRILSEKILV